MTTATSGPQKRFCTFFLGEERYGIDILTVREVNRQVQITPAKKIHPVQPVTSSCPDGWS